MFVDLTSVAGCGVGTAAVVVLLWLTVTDSLWVPVKSCPAESSAGARPRHAVGACRRVHVVPLRPGAGASSSENEG